VYSSPPLLAAYAAWTSGYPVGRYDVHAILGKFSGGGPEVWYANVLRLVKREESLRTVQRKVGLMEPHCEEEGLLAISQLALNCLDSLLRNLAVS